MQLFHRRRSGNTTTHHPAGGSATRLREATTEDWYWGRLTTSGTEEDRYWRRLSDNWGQKDVIPAIYLELHNQVWEAYNANPLANAIVEMGVNFTLGDGVRIDASSSKLQQILDGFWNDPDNRMHLRQYDIATELSLYGELFIRFFVNPYSGHLKIAQLDPSLVDEIECDPQNIERQLRVHRRDTNPSGAVDGFAAAADPDARGRWFSVPDEIAHFAINKVTNAKRGKSDLATLLPWLRRYKDWLIDRARINKYKSAFIWDIAMAGADRHAIAERMTQLARPPEPGSLNIHNESETWTAVQPHIASDDAAADGQAIKLMVAMGAGLPEHYLSEGGNVNRATAAEMGLPVIKKYQRRQDYLNVIFRALLDRAIAEAQRAGKLGRGADLTYTVRFPELQATAAEQQGTAALRMAQALQIARTLGIVSTETASMLFFDACREEIDVQKELQKIDPLAANDPNVAVDPAGVTARPPAQAAAPDAAPVPGLLNAHYRGAP